MPNISVAVEDDLAIINTFFAEDNTPKNKTCSIEEFTEIVDCSGGGVIYDNDGKVVRVSNDGKIIYDNDVDDEVIDCDSVDDDEIIYEDEGIDDYDYEIIDEDDEDGDDENWNRPSGIEVENVDELFDDFSKRDTRNTTDEVTVIAGKVLEVLEAFTKSAVKKIVRKEIRKAFDDHRPLLKKDVKKVVKKYYNKTEDSIIGILNELQDMDQKLTGAASKNTLPSLRPYPFVNRVMNSDLPSKADRASDR